MRVRNYEQPLDPTLVSLDSVFGPTSVRLFQAKVTGIDTNAQHVHIEGDQISESLDYERVILAVGSELQRPAIPGLEDHSFDVDTYSDACKLQAHLQTLPGRYTAVVIGAGLTGIELAVELPLRMREFVGDADRDKVRIVLVDPPTGSARRWAARNPSSNRR